MHNWGFSHSGYSLLVTGYWEIGYWLLKIGYDRIS